MQYNIWMEGYSCTGESAVARLIATHEGDSFRDACVSFSKNVDAKRLGIFDEENLSFWGCRLFENEKEARLRFG